MTMNVELSAEELAERVEKRKTRDSDIDRKSVV